MASSAASARAALMLFFMAGLFAVLLAAGASAAEEKHTYAQQLQEVAAGHHRFRLRLGEEIAAPAPVGAAAAGHAETAGDSCDLVPQTCTPAGWVPGNPFPMHPKDEACCVVIRSQGISCLCKLWKVWNVPKEVVKSYRKDCKLSDKLSC